MVHQIEIQTHDNKEWELSFDTHGYYEVYTDKKELVHDLLMMLMESLELDSLEVRITKV